MTPEQITLLWKKEIESINIRGFSREVVSVDCFKMNKYYTGEGVLTDCFKVNFNFEGISYKPCSEIHLNHNEVEEWNKTLEAHFISKFGEVIHNTQYGDLLFHNEICDYMVNQGYRFIIQFYLPGVISKLREEKLNQIVN
jgi:hypothetical protein